MLMGAIIFLENTELANWFLLYLFGLNRGLKEGPKAREIQFLYVDNSQTDCIYFLVLEIE